MSYARIAVSIPPDDARKIGKIQWPTAPPGDPKRNFVTVSTEHLDKRSFGNAVTGVARENGAATGDDIRARLQQPP